MSGREGSGGETSQTIGRVCVKSPHRVLRWRGNLSASPTLHGGLPLPASPPSHARASSAGPGTHLDAGGGTALLPVTVERVEQPLELLRAGGAQAGQDPEHQHLAGVSRCRQEALQFHVRHQGSLHYASAASADVFLTEEPPQHQGAVRGRGCPPAGAACLPRLPSAGRNKWAGAQWVGPWPRPPGPAFTSTKSPPCRVQATHSSSLASTTNVQHRLGGVS